MAFRSSLGLPTAPLADISLGLGLLATTVFYVLAGWLGLLWTFQTGIASPIWAPAGIGLAAVLLFGLRVWIGIATGSIIVMLLALSSSGLESASPTQLVMVPGLVGLGAGLQVVVSALILYRFAGFPNQLANVRDVVRFLLFAGPLGCLVNATISPAVLVASGTVPAAAWLETAIIWWVGDMLGVLIFTPMILVWGLRPKKVWRHRRIPVSATLLVAFFATGAAYTEFRELHKARIIASVEQGTAEISRNFSRQLQMEVDNLRRMDGFFSALPNVTPETYSKLVSQLRASDPAILALAWNEHFSEAERPRIEAMLQQYHGQDRRITERRPDVGLVPAASRSEYVSVVMIEPREGNEEAIGYDLLSNPMRREALERARDSGEPAATGRIDLVQGGSDAYGFLILYPNYSVARSPETVEQRRAAISGYLTAVFSAERFVGSVLGDFEQKGLRICFVDAGAPPGQQMLYETRTGSPGAADGEGYAAEWTYSAEMFGREWALRVAVSDDYVNSMLRRSGWEVVIPGLLISALAGMLALIVTGQNVTLANTVRERTRELKNEIAERRVAEETARTAADRLTLLMDSVPAQICYFDSGLRLHYVNRYTETWFALDRNELIGRRLTDVLPEAACRQLSGSLKQAIAGERQNFFGLVTYPDGLTRDVESMLIPDFGDDGTVNGTFLLTQNATKRKQLEEKLRESEKLEAVSAVTGGIAHEFNNLFQVLSANLEIIQYLGPENTPDVERKIESAMAAVFRAKVLTGRMLSYTGNPFDSPETFGVAESLKEIVGEMRTVLNEKVVMTLEAADESLSIQVDPQEFKNAIANLAYNARDAMPEGGWITTVVSAVSHGQSSESPLPAEMPAGEYVCVALTDTGAGMQPKIVEKAFDPFFTTKDVGMGAGLGLSMIYGFVQVQSKGHIKIDSFPGLGTTVSLYFPRAEALRDEDQLLAVAV